MDEFVDDAVTPLVGYEKVSKKRFQPWHKPRKQWCRFNQWCKSLTDIIDSVGSGNLHEVKYLGLPGDDLLDLRVFAHLCKRKGVLLKYLGFNTIFDKQAASDELSLSESELYKMGSISAGSSILTQPLESLSNKSSSSYVTASGYRGFHMINLDLCNSIASKGADHSGDTYFKAITNLLPLQLNNMRDPWCLFITTHISRESIVEHAIVPLLEAIRDNAVAHADFMSLMEEKIYVDLQKINDSIVDYRTLDCHALIDTFSLGLSKWLLKCMFSISKDWEMEMLDSCNFKTGYHESGAPDMLSLGFKFTYRPITSVTDLYGLASPSVGDRVVSEVDCAKSIILSVERIFNLDAMLSRDRQLLDELVKHSSLLLSSARYDADEYLAWVNQGCPIS